MFRLFAISGLAAAYALLRIVLPLRAPWPLKLLLAAVILFAGFKFQIIRLLGGPQFFAPLLPGWLIAASGVLYAALVMTALAGLCNDLLILATFRHFPALHLPIALLSLGVALYGLYAATRVPDIRDYGLFVKNLPRAATELKIAVLADLHVDPWTKAAKIESIVQRTSAAAPDLVLIAGDFADGPARTMARELEPLKRLRAPLGVYAVPGNHEYYNGWSGWKEELEKLGIAILENQGLTLSNGLYLAGLADPAARRTGDPGPDLQAALQDAPAGACIILLAHQPSLRLLAEPAGVALQISGHTHGGMVKGLDKLVARHNTGTVRGLYKNEDETYSLFITSGVSLWNGFPLRLGVPPEIAILHLLPPRCQSPEN